MLDNYIPQSEKNLLLFNLVFPPHSDRYRETRGVIWIMDISVLWIRELCKISFLKLQIFDVVVF